MFQMILISKISFSEIKAAEKYINLLLHEADSNWYNFT